jgi:hypothetical protein
MFASISSYLINHISSSSIVIIHFIFHPDDRLGMDRLTYKTNNSKSEQAHSIEEEVRMSIDDDEIKFHRPKKVRRACQFEPQEAIHDDDVVLAPPLL